MDDFTLDEVKILPCKVCKRDVPDNVAYPITEVTCQSCYLMGTPRQDGTDLTDKPLNF